MYSFRLSLWLFREARINDRTRALSMSRRRIPASFWLLSADWHGRTNDTAILPFLLSTITNRLSQGNVPEHRPIIATPENLSVTIWKQILFRDLKPSQLATCFSFKPAKEETSFF